MLFSIGILSGKKRDMLIPLVLLLLARHNPLSLHLELAVIDLCDVEQRAAKATRLEAFPINLEDVRRSVSTILSEFGKHGFFDEYTVHDFSHCYEMLKVVDWLVPRETAKRMTDG